MPRKRTVAILLVALALYGQACAGASKGPVAAAIAYRQGQYKTALALYRPLADQGNARAQYTIGLMYLDGHGVPQDYSEAMKWFRLAVEQGNADAQYAIGLMYRNGQGVPQDHSQAVKWFYLAAEQGNADAENKVGAIYFTGQGVPQDHAQAAKWFRLAAEQGEANAQFNLGILYHTGQGVPQNYAEALKWYRRAAEQGQPSAQGNLGFMYSNGRGVPQDYVEAHKWLSLAALSLEAIGATIPTDPGTFDAASEKAAAARARDALAAKMTPAQIAKAQKLAHDWTRTWACGGPCRSYYDYGGGDPVGINPSQGSIAASF
jgi:TPR repeat protein